MFSNAHILSTGLVLVDLPGESGHGPPSEAVLIQDFDVTIGLRDLNAARRNITERYLLNCNEIFSVCRIGRAVTDESVHDVFQLARRAHLSNVGIICTYSEVPCLTIMVL